MLLCGIQDINVTDWQNHTNYKGDYGPNDPTIVNFWKVTTYFIFGQNLSLYFLSRIIQHTSELSPHTCRRTTSMFVKQLTRCIFHANINVFGVRAFILFTWNA